MKIRDEIKNVLEAESLSIKEAAKRIGADFEKAVKILEKCSGKVVVSGIGKSGLIGNKISATFSSTGTPSMFLHPVEAVHGDMGIVMDADAAVLISQSGETDEVLEMLPHFDRLKVPVIAITGKTGSSLAKKAACVLDSSVEKEACPMGLAPTASTIVQLAIGDALAVALLKIKNFSKDDFARLHPGGALGKRLVLKVKDIMHTGEELPLVTPDTELKGALVEITNKRFGCAVVKGENGSVEGIFTDGDLRRLLEKTPDPFEKKMRDIMTKGPRTISGGELVIYALSKMEENAITVLAVTDDKGRPKGILHLHDILREGVVL